jgi:hypothetical protein
VKLTVNAFVGLDGTMQGPAGPEEYDNPFPPERGGWLMPFSDQLGWRSRHRLVRPSRRDPAWPHQLSDHRPHWGQITDSDDPVAAATKPSGHGPADAHVPSSSSTATIGWGISPAITIRSTSSR